MRDENFPHNPVQAIKNGFAQAELQFLRYAEESGDISGSCAIVALVLGTSRGFFTHIRPLNNCWGGELCLTAQKSMHCSCYLLSSVAHNFLTQTPPMADNVCYVANCGDSRAVYSEKRGKTVKDMSQDHKPDERREMIRIE